MVQLSSMISFKNIENSIDNLATAAWVWDADRNRIIAANGEAVKFWQELSVLDLIDTLFGEYHPMSLQFAKATAQISNDVDLIDQTIDFGSMDIEEKIDCQFVTLNSEDGRALFLIKIAEPEILPQADEESDKIGIQNDDIIAKMLENAPAALALFDREGKFCYANAHCQQIFTKSSEKFTVPTTLSDWFAEDQNKPDDANTIVKNLIEKCFSYKIANTSAKLNTAFGARVHSVIAKSFAIKPFNDGEPYVLIYLRDVADERHYEQILIERIAKLEQLTQLGSDFYFILDDELDFVQLGGNFEQLTGYPASELLGENWQTIAERFELDPDGVASAYFADQKSFDNLSITWPVKDTETGLSLTWRGRSIYEQQNGENIFVGSFVTAFENILAISDTQLLADGQVDSISDHVELIDADDDEIDSDVDDDITETEIDDIDGFDDEKDIAALAELDGANEDDINAETAETNQQTNIIELTTLETNLSDDEAVNFAAIGESLTADAEEVAKEEATAEVEKVVEEIEETVEETAEVIEASIEQVEEATEQSEEISETETSTETQDEAEDLYQTETIISTDFGDETGASVEDVIARSDDVIAEINQLLGEDASSDTIDATTSPVAENVSENSSITQLADNIVPAFGATAEDIGKFGRTEVDMFKLVLDQTPVMAVVTSLPSAEGIYTLFANKEILHNLGMIQDKNQDLSSDDYSNILSVETMEYLNSLKDEFTDTPLDQEVSFLVGGEKHYFNAKINEIDWQSNKALQFILSPKINIEGLNPAPVLQQAAETSLALASTQTAQSIASDLPQHQDEDMLQFVLDGQSFIDKDQKILSSNVYLNNILGMTSDDLIGKQIGSIVVETDFSAFQDYANSVLQDEEKNLNQDGVELSLINKTGENHTIFMQIQRLKAEEAKDFPSDILVNMRDISMWKKKETSLLEAKDRAEQENKQKSGFLARISHELRTPLNAIIGFSEVMSDEKFGPLENSRYKGYANDINESGEHLLSLINDLLDLSKVEAGKVELDFKALDLEPLLIQAVSLMQPMADKKRIIIRTSISSSLPQIIADMRSIRQIVLNLLSNSIKYSNSGGQVVISALLNDDGEVIIRVRDTGIGMADDQLEAAMEPFKTLNMSTLVGRQGTGLGLPLTKALAEANRAEFSIESAVDAGTLVQITFPTTRVLNA